MVQVGSFLLQHEQEVQRESVDLHSLSAKEARAAVLCILCNIQVCLASHLSPPEALAHPVHAKVLGHTITVTIKGLIPEVFFA